MAGLSLEHAKNDRRDEAEGGRRQDRRQVSVSTVIVTTTSLHD